MGEYGWEIQKMSINRSNCGIVDHGDCNTVLVMRSIWTSPRGSWCPHLYRENT